jgi:hypothetical protein
VGRGAGRHRGGGHGFALPGERFVGLLAENFTQVTDRGTGSGRKGFVPLCHGSDYGAKYPKAVAKIVDDADVLLEFYKYPAEHWIHLRTTNPIESTFATVLAAHQGHQGPRIACYKLIDAAQARWRAVNAPHLVALVRAGALFHKGKLLERSTDINPAANPPESTGTEVA